MKPGEGVFHETQVQELQKLGLDITVICPRPFHSAPVRMLKKTYRKKDARPEYEIRKGIPVYRPFYRAVPGQLKWAQPHRRIASAVLKTMKQRGLYPDLIHAHFAMPSGGAAAVVSESAQIPYVLTLHGSDVNVYPHYSKGAFKAFKRAVGSASVVLAVSHKLRKKPKSFRALTARFCQSAYSSAVFRRMRRRKRKSEKDSDSRSISVWLSMSAGWSERKAFLNCLKRSNRCRTLLRQSLSGMVPQNRADAEGAYCHRPSPESSGKRLFTCGRSIRTSFLQ